MWMGIEWMGDVRYAVRGLVARPGFALVAVTTVGLGIGASTAVFSVVDAVVFRALPYEEPDRLVSLWTEFEPMGPQPFGLSNAEYIDLAAEQRSFASIGAYWLWSATWLPDGRDASRVDVAYVYPGLLDVLNVAVQLGRMPSSEEIEPDGAGLVLLTHEFWTARLGSSPDVVGSTMSLDGTRVEVVGVMEPGTRLPDAAPGVWAVFRRDRSAITDRSGHFLTGLGRLAPGADLAALQAELDGVHVRWAREWVGVHSPGHEGHVFRADRLDEVTLGTARPAAWALVAAAGLLLLVACVNVAGLLVARGETRLAELGIRSALGAGRARLARQLLAESLTLSLIGGLFGYAIASWGSGTLIGLDPSSLPGLDRVRPDLRSFGFALAASTLTGILFGLLPVARLPGHSALSLMGAGGRGGTGRRETRTVLSGLVVGQVALATTVIVAGALFARSRSALTAVDPGFAGDGAVVFDLEIPSARYDDLSSIDAFWAGLSERLAGLPGVRSVGVARSFPLRAPERREYILLAGPSAARSSDEPAPIVYQAARSGFLETMGISLLEGRSIEASDRADAPYVAVVSESAARAYWPGGAIGARFRATFAPDEHPAYTIVGVVADVAQMRLDVPPSPQIYIPLAQTPSPGRGWVRRASVVVRADSDPSALAPAIRRLVAELEPGAPVENMATLREVLRSATTRSRFLSVLVGAFAALALLVAAVGVYGTVSFGVARRRREFGVRVAMGEAPRSLVSRVLLGSLRSSVVGALMGLVAAWVLGPTLSGLLFAVGARDPVAFAVGPVAALAASSLAAVIPARRAVGIAPVESLRDPA